MISFPNPFPSLDVGKQWKSRDEENIFYGEIEWDDARLTCQSMETRPSDQVRVINVLRSQHISYFSRGRRTSLSVQRPCQSVFECRRQDRGQAIICPCIKVLFLSLSLSRLDWVNLTSCYTFCHSHSYLCLLRTIDREIFPVRWIWLITDIFAVKRVSLSSLDFPFFQRVLLRSVKQNKSCFVIIRMSSINNWNTRQLNDDRCSVKLQFTVRSNCSMTSAGNSLR